MCSFRKPINNGHDTRVTTRRRQTSYKINSNVRPRPVGNRERSEKTRSGLVTGLTPGTGITSSHKTLNIPAHGWPPKPLLQVGEGPSDPRVAGQK